MAQVRDYGLQVNEFEFQLRFHLYFRTNTLGKGMEPPYLFSYALDCIISVLL